MVAVDAYRIFVVVDIELIDVVTISPKLIDPVPAPIKSAFTCREEIDPWSALKKTEERVETVAVEMLAKPVTCIDEMYALLATVILENVLTADLNPAREEIS